MLRLVIGSFFFFNDTATTEIYTLSLHDALPISITMSRRRNRAGRRNKRKSGSVRLTIIRPTSSQSTRDRKSTRLNSSHLVISYAVFCLKKKNYPPISHYAPSSSHASYACSLYCR